MNVTKKEHVALKKKKSHELLENCVVYLFTGERPPVKVTVKESRVVTLVGQTARLECYSEVQSDRV